MIPSCDCFHNRRQTAHTSSFFFFFFFASKLRDGPLTAAGGEAEGGADEEAAEESQQAAGVRGRGQAAGTAGQTQGLHRQVQLPQPNPPQPPNSGSAL